MEIGTLMENEKRLIFCPYCNQPVESETRPCAHCGGSIGTPPKAGFRSAQTVVRLEPEAVANQPLTMRQRFSPGGCVVSLFMLAWALPVIGIVITEPLPEFAASLQFFKNWLAIDFATCVALAVIYLGVGVFMTLVFPDPNDP
jgi:hypothetical protein